MARQYTKAPAVAGDITMADDWNDEFGQSLATLNGDLDQNNMPMNSVTQAKFESPVVSSGVGYVHSTMPTQGYFLSYTLGTGQVSFSKDAWLPGWNKLEIPLAGPEGVALTFDALDGMLVGEAVIDLEWRMSYQAGYDNDTPPPPDPASVTIVQTMAMNFVDVGVFVNDVCVGRTGKQWLGGRFTFVVPYNTPIGSGPTKIDTRAIFYYQNSRSAIGYIMEQISIADINIGDAILWCRNQWR
jgi:hypothetical protein